MAERYLRLLSIDIPKWNIGSSVIMEKGALLRDTVTNTNLLQFQFRNVGPNQIKGMSISIKCLDDMNKSISEQIDYKYLDLSIRNNEIFGVNVPILVNKLDAREFIVSVNKVLFADGTINETSAVLYDVELPKNITELGVLTNQLVLDVKTLYQSVKCIKIPRQYDNYWYCVCGAFNSKENVECRVCGSECQLLMGLANIEELEKKHEKSEDQKIIAFSLDAEKRKSIRKRNILRGVIALGLVVIITVIAILVQNPISYGKAQNMLEAGNYDEAILTFKELGNYKDAENLILEAKYRKADEYLENKKYEDAYKLYTALGEYNDSEIKAIESKYQIAIETLNKKFYDSAASIFRELGEYKDSLEKLEEITGILASQNTIINNNVDVGSINKPQTKSKWDGNYTAYFQDEKDGVFYLPEEHNSSSEYFTINVEEGTVIRVCKGAVNATYYGEITEVDDNQLIWEYTPNYNGEIQSFYMQDSNTIFQDIGKTVGMDFYSVMMLSRD